MARGRHAGNRDRLRPQQLLDGLRLALGIVDRRHLGGVIVQPGQPFGRGIDRAADIARAGPHGAQRHDQIIQQHARPAAGSAHGIAAGVDLPSLGEAGHDNVVLFGIHEHVADALQTGQIAHGVVHRLAGFLPRRQFGFQPAQRNLAQFGRTLQIAGNRLERQLAAIAPAR